MRLDKVLFVTNKRLLVGAISMLTTEKEQEFKNLLRNSLDLEAED